MCTYLSGTLTIGLPGCGQYLLAMPVLPVLRPSTIRLAFDSDACTNPNVANALCRATDAIRRAGFHVQVETWDSQYKGIDDLLASKQRPNISSTSSAAFTDLVAYGQQSSMYPEYKPFTGFTGFRSRYAKKGMMRG